MRSRGERIVLSLVVTLLLGLLGHVIGAWGASRNQGGERMQRHGVPGLREMKMRHERASGLRFAWAVLLATCMAVCMVPMGCGSSEEHAVAPERT